MNEEMMAHTFVAESMTVETGRIIPSPALAEAVIGGIAQIIAERDALKAQWASVPWDDLGVVLMATAGIDGLYDFRVVVVDWANDNRKEESAG